MLQRLPPYTEMVQQNNPLLKRIYNLKLGKNEYKDPTLINQAKKQAQEEVERTNKILPAGGLSKAVQEALQQHLDWLHKCPYLASCSD